MYIIRPIHHSRLYQTYEKLFTIMIRIFFGKRVVTIFVGSINHHVRIAIVAEAVLASYDHCTIFIWATSFYTTLFVWRCIAVESSFEIENFCCQNILKKVWWINNNLKQWNRLTGICNHLYYFFRIIVPIFWLVRLYRLQGGTGPL